MPGAEGAVGLLLTAEPQSRDDRHPFGLDVRCDSVAHIYRTVQGHDVEALHGVDLAIESGERIALLGASGSGKSTLLALLGGIQRPSAGSIFLGERDIARMPQRELARVRASSVSTLLQGAERNLLSYASVRQNVEFVRLSHSKKLRRELPPPDELLRRVRLLDHANWTVASLSGGQRQRAALAAAVSTQPRILLADEPTSQLGDDDRDQVVELIHRIGDDLGTTILVVTHDPEVSATFARTVTIKSGRVDTQARDHPEPEVIGQQVAHDPPAHLVGQLPRDTSAGIEHGEEPLELRREGER